MTSRELISLAFIVSCPVLGAVLGTIGLPLWSIFIIAVVYAAGYNYLISKVK